MSKKSGYRKMMAGRMVAENGDGYGDLGFGSEVGT
jgi:hypothetical protein